MGDKNQLLDQARAFLAACCCYSTNYPATYKAEAERRQFGFLKKSY